MKFGKSEWKMGQRKRETEGSFPDNVFLNGRAIIKCF